MEAVKLGNFEKVKNSCLFCSKGMVRPVGRPVGRLNGSVGVGKSCSLLGSREPVGVGKFKVKLGSSDRVKNSCLFSFSLEGVGEPVGIPVGRLKGRLKGRGGRGRVGKASSLLPGNWDPLLVELGSSEPGNTERLENSCLFSAGPPVGSNGGGRLRLGSVNGREVGSGRSSPLASLNGAGLSMKAPVGNGMPERLKLGRRGVGIAIGAATHSCATRAAMRPSA